MGGGVWKKRLNQNRHRSIVLAKGRHYWVYQLLFAKQNQSNISQSELAWCLATVPPHIPAEQIKQLREIIHVSHPVFARYLNTSASAVKQWESGEKQPSGLALKLLSTVQKHGLEILA